MSTSSLCDYDLMDYVIDYENELSSLLDYDDYLLLLLFVDRCCLFCFYFFCFCSLLLLIFLLLLNPLLLSVYMFFLFLRDVSKFYYSSNDGILFIDFFEPFTLCGYEDFFFDFFLSFLPNDEFTCRLYLLFYNRELDRFLLFIKIFCCENIFLFALYVVLSFIMPRVNILFWGWFFCYWAFALPP